MSRGARLPGDGQRRRAASLTALLIAAWFWRLKRTLLIDWSGVRAADAALGDLRSSRLEKWPDPLPDDFTRQADDRGQPSQLVVSPSPGSRRRQRNTVQRNRRDSCMLHRNPPHPATVILTRTPAQAAATTALRILAHAASSCISSSAPSVKLLSVSPNVSAIDAFALADSSGAPISRSCSCDKTCVAE